MIATLFFETIPMAEEQGPSTLTVRMDAELVRLARIICAHAPGRSGNAKKLVDYIDEIVRQRILDDYASLVSRIKQAEPEQIQKPAKSAKGKKRSTDN